MVISSAETDRCEGITDKAFQSIDLYSRCSLRVAAACDVMRPPAPFSCGHWVAAIKRCFDTCSVSPCPATIRADTGTGDTANIMVF